MEDSPGELARLIGKKPNQVTNLLGGHSSFGEKVARSIELAAGLPTGWLDDDSQSGGNAIPGDVASIARQIAELPDRQREWMLQVVRDAFSGLELAKADLLARANGDLLHSEERGESVTQSPVTARKKARG